MHVSGAKLAILSVMAFLFSIALIGCASVSISNHKRVILGVQASDKTLAGMSLPQVRSHFEKTAAHHMKDGAVHLSYGQQEWILQPSDIGLAAHVEEAAHDAYRFGHSGKIFQDLATQLECAIFGHNITMDAGYDKEMLLARLNEIAAAIHAQPSNASCVLQGNGAIQKIPAVIGRQLDTASLAESLNDKLVSLNLPAKVELQPESQFPEVRDEDLAAIDHVLGVYTTHFYPGDRGDNIAIAAGHLNGILVRAQSTFSFNNTVGPRTAAGGYKDAGVIINGQMAQDVGGGVCQVSSTLYNAILLAGLTPTARTAHFYPSTYCPPGLDATVADGLIDFQFQNRLPHNVYLLSSIGYDTLTIYILGTLADLQGNTIDLTCEGSSMTPSVYRIYRRNGELIEKEYLHTDAYSNPQDA